MAWDTYYSTVPRNYGHTAVLSTCPHAGKNFQDYGWLRSSFRWPYWLIIKSKLWLGLSKHRNQASRTFGVREFQFEKILQRIPPGCLWILLQPTAAHFTRPCQNPKFKTVCSLPRLWVIKSGVWDVPLSRTSPTEGIPWNKGSLCFGNVSETWHGHVFGKVTQKLEETQGL